MHKKRTYFLLKFNFFLSILLFSTLLQGQTEISGVVNQYAKVLGIGACPYILRVDDTEGFAAGQPVLLLSMQGGEMSANNDNNFGLVQSEGLSAGLYDWSYIEVIQGNEITLNGVISEGYDFSEAVQLVGVPLYEAAVVTGELVPLPWNGATGGVVALEVNTSLELEADINATGHGFRGGVSVQATDDVCTFLTSADNYFYEAGNWRGASKGEGIIDFIPGKENGRGPQANGGGGSNTHNAGGGGGSNTSAGGLGGENREPSFGGCNGFFPGQGGLALSFGSDRWFMGGGGGAGHRNNSRNNSGGNGGGLIVIKAGTLAFNGGNLRADGQDGNSSSGDGGGGGGGGGTIVLDLNSITGTGLMSARGGKGGDADSSVGNRCMGPGGGGSGGQVYSTVQVSPSLAGGISGMTINSGSCPDGPNGALPGEDGSWALNGIKGSSALPALQFLSLSSDTTICKGSALVLSADVLEVAFEVNYQWQINSDDGWTPLADDDNYEGTTTSSLFMDSLGTEAAFRLIINTACTESLTSESIKVIVDTVGVVPVPGFNVQTNDLTATFENISQGASTFEWTIKEIPSYQSTAFAPEFTFPEYGVYEVGLKAFSQCGMDRITQTITIGMPPRAAFLGASSGNNCVPLTIDWSDQSQGVFDTYFWEFPGGNPATSEVPNPVVTYDSPGVYDVRLTIDGPLGESTRIRENAVEVFSVPQPEFSYQIENLTVKFTGNNTSGIEHIWFFGEGGTSREENPEYTFSGPGVYDVTLNLQALGCARSITQTIFLAPTSTKETVLSKKIKLGPNPTSGVIQLESSLPNLFPLDVWLFSSKGQLLDRRKIYHAGSIDLSAFSPGVYWIRISSSLGIGSWRVIKQ